MIMDPSGKDLPSVTKEPAATTQFLPMTAPLSTTASMPIKVLSLVPADASNIRDASTANLAAVDALRFRASVFRVLVYVFAGLTVVLVVLALVRQVGAHHFDRNAVLFEQCVVEFPVGHPAGVHQLVVQGANLQNPG